MIRIPEKTVTNTIIQTKVFNQFEIRSVRVILDEKAEIEVELFYVKEEVSPLENEGIILFPVNVRLPIDRKTIVLEGDDYKQWGSDDSYIKNYVMNYLSNL